MDWWDVVAGAVAQISMCKEGAHIARELLWMGDKFPGGAPEVFHGPAAAGANACLDDASRKRFMGLVGSASGTPESVDMPVESGMGWGRVVKPLAVLERHGDGTDTHSWGSETGDLHAGEGVDAGMLTVRMGASLSAPLGSRSNPRSPNVTTLGGFRYCTSETCSSASLSRFAAAL